MGRYTFLVVSDISAVGAAALEVVKVTSGMVADPLPASIDEFIDKYATCPSYCLPCKTWKVITFEVIT